MAPPDPLHTFFVVSWHCECVSRENRQRVGAWAVESGGLVPGSLDAIVALVASQEDAEREWSVAVTNWLLARTGEQDRLAGRVLAQALRRTVLRHVKIMMARRRRDACPQVPFEELRGLAITALGLAIARIASRPSSQRGAKWPRWRLESEYQRCLRRVVRDEAPEFYDDSAWSEDRVEFDESLPHSTSEPAEIVLGRELADAVVAGVVCPGDARLLWLREAGFSITELAEASAMQPRSMRKKLWRCQGRLHAAELAS